MLLGKSVRKFLNLGENRQVELDKKLPDIFKIYCVEDSPHLKENHPAMRHLLTILIILLLSSCTSTTNNSNDLAEIVHDYFSVYSTRADF